ncbi:hypothetical protein B0J14DRAFT_677584 [Halenospora varia]|nr:hypothetical protein B0J14DRAFT_677584 [Halenospora varia]
MSKNSFHKSGKKHRHHVKKSSKSQNDTVAVPAAGDDYLTEYAADVDEAKSIRRKKKAEKKHRIAVTPPQDSQNLKDTTPVETFGKRKRDEVESLCENSQKKKKARRLSPSLRKQRRQDRRRSPATMKLLIKPYSTDWYSLSSEEEDEDEEMEDGTPASAAAQIDEDNETDHEEYIATPPAPHPTQQQLIDTIYKANDHGSAYSQLSTPPIRVAQKPFEFTFSSTPNGADSHLQNTTPSQPIKSRKSRVTSLAIRTKPHFQDDSVTKALPDMNNSLSMISPNMFGSFPHNWSANANGSPQPSSSALARRCSMSAMPANYLPSPLSTNNNNDLVENWEHQPGKIRALAGVNDDTEKEENIAFSSHYIHTRTKSSITISKNTYSIITLAPGATCHLNTQNGIKICSVARGGQVKVRWCTRKVRRTFYIGEDGVWRVRKGEYCAVSNDEDEEVVVHAFDCKDEE